MSTDTASHPAVLQSIPLDQIVPSPYQTRTDFDPETLKELASTLKEHGLLNAIVIRKVGNSYELIAGERRVRAARLLGWTTIDAKIQEVDDLEAAQLVVVENLQRDDLNPIEQAEGYKKLQKMGLTLDKIAVRVGIADKGTISRAISLLDLPRVVQEMLSRGNISEGHIRYLGRINSQKLLIQLAKQAAAEGWSVKETERRVSRLPGQNPADGRQFSSIRKPVDPFESLWPNLVKEAGMPEGTWGVRYQRGGTWVFTVKTRGINPVDVLSDWFQFMARSMPRTSPLRNEGGSGTGGTQAEPVTMEGHLAEIRRTMPPDVAEVLAAQYAQIEAEAKRKKK